MKYLKIKFVFALLAIFVIVGCEDVLDTEKKDAFAEDLIYSDPDQVERVVYTAYNSTESWSINRFAWWTQRIDLSGSGWEAKFNFNDLDNPYKMRGGWSPSNVGLAFRDKWRNYFDYVRLINEFLDKIDDSPAMQSDTERVSILKAEMQFLRANTYSKLIKIYGGVPIMENALGLDDDFNLPRDSYEDCVDFIIRDLDAAAEVLPLEASIFGRATKLSALAVKSRTLLYAASILHDPSTVPNGPVYDYNRPSKWQDAADAAQEVINLVGDRDLIPVADATAYQQLFLSPNQDILFARSYGPFYEMQLDANTLPDQAQSPNGYGGWALNSPTHNFALDFNMADGTTTDGMTFDPANPNDNREMRYYANLLFQGADFRGRPVDYALADNPSETTPDGLDSPNGGGNALHSSKTGYNIRKFQDESLSALTDISPNRPYILYRLAEIYLNYAEALYHVGGQEDLSRQYLNRVASRAHLPEITVSGEALLEAIKRERRIELCFEGHNFFDERRWMQQDHIGGYDIKGLKWRKATDGSLYFTEETVVNRPWFEYRYYLPIPQSEVEKAPALLPNNYGY